ncbi:ImuA family protein [Sphingomonas sp. LaA6.9]|uniref:ImuA family protein n=1 Tax=Sphingomonas sp. LaA6.9 TaxID=2919914 RepID=UPI001F4F9B1D|nr:hypothetical protein [Sphingomonas sp. LaA6.9]MCJ8155843.1 hypothetical protein [Sphingomonas sp. LaA6.9]
MHQVHQDGRFPTGHDALDTALGGGLARGRVHELFADEHNDAASTAGFAAMLALRSRHSGAPILWLRTDEAERRCGRLYAPGLAELGGDPDALLIALAPNPAELLRGAADAARCVGLGALVVECWGQCPALDLTASRRLALAAEQSGVTVILLRIEARAMPSAADTRWAVRSAQSVALEADAPGPALFEIELLRRRSGPSGMRWRVEWDRDQCVFREPALSGALVPLSTHGSAEAPAARELRRSA